MTNAQSLIGKKIQKPESTKRSMVVEIKKGFFDDLTMVVFADGSKAQYKNSDIAQLVKNGTHNHQTI